MKIRPSDQPVAYSNAVRAILAALVLLHAVTLSAEQIAGLVIAVESVLGAFVWSAVTPTKDADAQVAQAKSDGIEQGANEAVVLMAAEKPKPAPRKAAPRKARR